MADIMLPRRFKSQPQYAAPLDKGSPYFPFISFAYSAGRGAEDGAHPGHLGSVVGSMSYGAGLTGRHIKTNDASSYLQFASLNDYNILGEVMIFARIRTGSLGTQQAIIIKTESGGGANTPFGLLIESDGSVALNRAGSGHRVWASAAKLAANTDYVIAASQVTDTSIAPKFYINGILDPGAATNLYSGTWTGAATATTQSVKLGNRTDLASRFLGEIRDVFVFNKILSSHGTAQVSQELDQLWKKPRRQLQIVVAGSVQGTIAFTEDSDIVNASGTTTVKGNISFTEEDDAVAAEGASGGAVIGAVSFTEEDDTVVALGTSSIIGNISFIEADDTVSVSGVVTSDGVVGAIDFIEADDTVIASGTLTIPGVISFTEEDDIVIIIAVTTPGWSVEEPATSAWTLASTTANTWTKASSL